MPINSEFNKLMQLELMLMSGNFDKLKNPGYYKRSCNNIFSSTILS